jgi:alpha-beta hydrolase superfamily lysophospholipase
MSPVALAWPERRTDGLDVLVTSTPVDVIEERQVTGFIGGGLASGTIQSTVHVLRAERAGCGVVREVQLDDGARAQVAGARPIVLQFVGRVPEAFEAEVGTNASGQGVVAVDFRVVEPPGAPRGVVMHLSSLGAYEHEAPLVDELAARGWLVLTSDYPWIAYSAREVDVDGPAELDDVARRIAERIDGRLAAWADAAAAVLEHVRRRRPPLEEAPVVVVGLSAGAIAGPAVAARMLDDVRALVVMGGGANVLSISSKSDLDTLETRVSSGGRPLSDAMASDLDARYLESSRLDPWHAARAVVAVPTLVVDARFDAVVHADAGTLLWERLGRPERWRVLGGHSILFWRIPGLSPDIADWIERAVEAR